MKQEDLYEEDGHWQVREGAQLAVVIGQLAIDYCDGEPSAPFITIELLKDKLRLTCPLQDVVDLGYVGLG